MSLLVLLRHGLSQWNKENRFTGWMDVPLTEEGREQARNVAPLLRDYQFDIAYTSVLERAIDTLEILLQELQHPKILIVKEKNLNERHYGELQGKNKEQIKQQYGEEQFHLWRRSYLGRPPGGESLQDTAGRVLLFLSSTIVPQLDAGKNVLVVAHGNTLRAMVMDIEKIHPEKISTQEISYCVPLVYERREGKFFK